jgi:DNA-binding HxlR family transcriptional regulator
MTSAVKPRPIVQLIDLLGKKWVLRILWELNEKPCTFRELQSRCGDLSPTIINTRIKDLCSAKLVSKTPDTGYTLSDNGKELIELFYPINDFAQRWTKVLTAD